MVCFSSCSEEPTLTQKSQSSYPKIDSTDTALMVVQHKRVLNKFPKDSLALSALAQHYLSIDQPDKAIIYLEKLAKFHPDTKTDSLLLENYVKLNLFDQALEIVESKQQSDVAFRLRKAELLQKAGRNTESNLLLDSLIEVNGASGELYLLKGINFMALQDTSRACQLFQQSLQRGEILNDSLLQVLCPQINTSTG